MFEVGCPQLIPELNLVFGIQGLVRWGWEGLGVCGGVVLCDVFLSVSGFKPGSPALHNGAIHINNFSYLIRFILWTNISVLTEKNAYAGITLNYEFSC